MQGGKALRLPQPARDSLLIRESPHWSRPKRALRRFEASIPFRRIKRNIGAAARAPGPTIEGESRCQEQNIRDRKHHEDVTVAIAFYAGQSNVDGAMWGFSDGGDI